VALEIPNIPGAEDVVRWFGYWPDFHDAEVLSITLNRSTGPTVEIHTFERTPEVDARGFYVLAKHAIVTFVLGGFPLSQEGMATTRIDYFNHQNVLSSAGVEETAGGYPSPRHRQGGLVPGASDREWWEPGRSSRGSGQASPLIEINSQISELPEMFAITAFSSLGTRVS